MTTSSRAPPRRFGSRPNRVDWLIFGDDHGAHPSTTQHLVARFPLTDRVVWVDSIGMRAPRLTTADLRRVTGRLRAIGRRSQKAKAATSRLGPSLRVVRPTVAPWHDSRLARAVNARVLGSQIERALASLGITRPNVLLSNPVGQLYLPKAVAQVGYLRLDDYPTLPGVDAELVGPLDQRLLREADLVFGTARALLPGPPGGRLHYLPQGVDTAHWAGVPAPEAGQKTLGFFGLLAEWLDYDLVRDVAAACPGWTLEFRGPVRSAPADLGTIANLRLLPALPYSELPGAIGHWSAAWIPFCRSTLTEGVNPLKLREYLAAGLPTASTPLPEVRALGDDVTLVETAADVSTWLAGSVAADTAAARQARRDRMAAHDWSARAATLRDAFAVAAA